MEHREGDTKITKLKGEMGMLCGKPRKPIRVQQNVAFAVGDIIYKSDLQIGPVKRPKETESILKLPFRHQHAEFGQSSSWSAQTTRKIRFGLTLLAYLHA
jgi:hypothetical protein